MGGLSVSDLVQVTINITPSGAAALSFGVLMVAGDTPVINGVQRFRTYTDALSVSEDFGSTAPETLAAELFFGQKPQPATLMVGRWFSTASAAQNDGGILSPSEQTIANWQSISAGSFVIHVDGVTYTLTGLDFTGVTNLNGVASVITAALVAASSTATCIWNGTNFVIQSGTQGLGNHATGTVTFTANPANNDTLTLNGQVITFKTVVSGPNEVLIGGSDTATAANLQAFLMSSTDPLLLFATYARTGLVITVTYVTVGVVGNSYTMTAASAALTLSGATLLGGTEPSSVGFATTAGSGTDISAQLKLTALTSQLLVPAFAAETPVQCATALALASPLWYGLMFASVTPITVQQNLDVSAFIEAQQITRVYGVTIQDTSVLSSLVSNDLASELKALGYDQSLTQYSSTNPYAIASFFGRAFSVDFTGSNTTINLMFKQEPGVIAETLTEAQAQTLKLKNCNVFVNYVNNTMILQFGVVASGQFFDTIQGVDWLQNYIQTQVYNVLYTTTTKVPQTDPGVNQITNAVSAACNQGVNNGLIGPGTWNGPSFGQLTTGQFLKTGFYIFAASIALQPEADRAARKCPPIQVAVKLAGAIQSVFITVNVNQ